MNFFNRIGDEVKNFRHELRARTAPIPGAVLYEVPYLSQFARAAHAEPIMKREWNAVDDLYWADTGAITPERYAAWALAACGMAVTAMALKYFKGFEVRFVDLAEDALQGGVYVEDEKGIGPMLYREFAMWVVKYGLQADVYSRLSLAGIRLALSEGKLPMVSVNPNIRGYNTSPADRKGGHLVLIVGYDTVRKEFCIHNPSGFESLGTQQNHRMSEEVFARYYAGRGLAVSPLSSHVEA